MAVDGLTDVGSTVVLIGILVYVVKTFLPRLVAAIEGNTASLVELTAAHGRTVEAMLSESKETREFLGQKMDRLHSAYREGTGMHHAAITQERVV